MPNDDKQKQLESLRLSVKRIAEATGDELIINLIPKNISDDRGWNYLCDELIAYLFDIKEDSRA